MPEHTPGDHLRLNDLRIMALCGCLPEERDRAQPFVVQLDLSLDLRAAGDSDDLADTVDYGALCERMNGVATQRHHALMEHLASRMADSALSDDRVQSATVSVSKLRPPVPFDLGSATVTVTRSR